MKSNNIDELEEAKKIMSGTEPKIKVTIIIQNKNYAQFLRKTILSCIIQDYPKDQYEIIGYDANSDDKSMEVYNEFKGRIKIVEVGDKLQPAALNQILKEHAKGEYISIINSDDWLLPHFVKIHADAFDNPDTPKDVVMAYSNATQMLEDGIRTIYEPKDKNKKLILKEKIFERNFVFQPSVMIRRSALDRIGLFDEKLKHAWDYDMWMKLAKIGKWAYVDSITTVYRMHRKMGSVVMREGIIKDLIKMAPRHLKIAQRGVYTPKDKEKLKKFLKDNLRLTDKEFERSFNETYRT